VRVGSQKPTSGHSICQEMAEIELPAVPLRSTIILRRCTIIIIGWTNREWMAALHVARRIERAQRASRPSVVSRLL
jgi:hypothetical protein